MITILTPTYNRAKLLQLCFDSLCAQTDFDFEWLIVDDGSTDNTEEVVNGFLTDKFPVQYVKKQNGGKHTALNAAHPYINGQYVLILDSDDTLTADAVERIKRAWAGKENDRSVARWLEVKNKELYYIVTAAENEKAAAETTVACLRGYADCVEGAKEMGIIYGIGAYEKGEILAHPAMDEAYEMGKGV